MREIVGAIVSLLFLLSGALLVVGSIKPALVARVVPGMKPEGAGKRRVLLDLAPVVAAFLALSIVLLWVPHYQIHGDDPANVVLTATPTLTVQVKNAGLLSGTFRSSYAVDGQGQPEVNLPLKAWSTGTIELPLPVSLAPGAHTVTVAGEKIAIVALRPAAFRCSRLTGKPAVVKIGQEIFVNVTVKNSGDVSGEFPGVLKVNGKQVDAKATVIGPGEQTTLYYSVKRKSPGTCRIQIDSARASVMVVRPIRLANGKVLRNTAGGGRSAVEFQNKERDDAMAFLIRSSKTMAPVVVVYVRGHSKAKIANVADGAYGVYWCFGRDWNTYTSDFLVSSGRIKYLKPLVLHTTSSTNYWTTWDSWGYTRWSQSSTHWYNWTYFLAKGTGKYQTDVTESKFPGL